MAAGWARCRFLTAIPTPSPILNSLPSNSVFSFSPPFALTRPAVLSTSTLPGPLSLCRIRPRHRPFSPGLLEDLSTDIPPATSGPLRFAPLRALPKFISSLPVRLDQPPNPQSSRAPPIPFEENPFRPPHAPNSSMANTTSLAAHRAGSAEPVHHPRLDQGPENMCVAASESASLPSTILRR